VKATAAGLGEHFHLRPESNAPTRPGLAVMKPGPCAAIEADFGLRACRQLAGDIHPDLRADYVIRQSALHDSRLVCKDDERALSKYGVPPRQRQLRLGCSTSSTHLCARGIWPAFRARPTASMSSNQSGRREISRALIEADW